LATVRRLRAPTHALGMDLTMRVALVYSVERTTIDVQRFEHSTFALVVFIGTGTRPGDVLALTRPLLSAVERCAVADALGLTDWATS
jgi:hypothetical protein